MAIGAVFSGMVIDCLPKPNWKGLIARVRISLPSETGLTVGDATSVGVAD